jgi:60 kDa SS-A/Ro ribonucleoprotein
VIRLLNASIGNDPTMRDILRMARPTPKDDQRRALFGWLAGRDVASWGPATESDLPLEVQRLEKYRRAEREEEQLEVLEALRGVRWELFADGAKGPKVWARIAETMGPQALRMNLNTLARHEVFGERSRDGRSMMELVAARIADEKEVRQSRQFPYQYFTSYLFAEEGVPERVRKSLNEAAEIACGNVPKLPGPIVIGLDASGSMGSPVTGKRTASGTTKMTCRDVAALIAAALLRANPGSVVIPFDTQAYTGWYQRLRQPASILELAGYLKGFGGGGTNCAVPVEAAMKHFGEREFAGVVIISDNESWWGRGHAGSTALATAWKAFVFRQRLQFKTQFHPKLVCIDLQPNTTTQVPDRQDVLNIGGFSDSVFSTIGRFFDGAPKHWVDEVEAIEL